MVVREAAVPVAQAAAVPVDKEPDRVDREAALRAVVDLGMLDPADAVQPVVLVQAQRRTERDQSRCSRFVHSTMGGRGCLTSGS